MSIVPRPPAHSTQQCGAILPRFHNVHVGAGRVFELTQSFPPCTNRYKKPNRSDMTRLDLGTGP